MKEEWVDEIAEKVKTFWDDPKNKKTVDMILSSNKEMESLGMLIALEILNKTEENENI